MTLFGLHPLDAALIVAYIVIVLGIGQYLSRKTRLSPLPRPVPMPRLRPVN